VETAQHEAAAVLRDPALADLPSTPPPIAALRHEEERAAAAHETAVEAGATLTLGAAELTDALHEHAERTVAHAPLAEEAGRLRRLAEVTSGSGNALRVSLERYVLGAFLAEIAERASRRLGAMSDGRYALLHSEEREKGGAPSGLGIRVRDAWTGAIRDVGSLSGGETFQASLALALGIADAVTAHAGGVRLDALFVDEGFGSLDPEALELAITELDHLREGGRLVGVISHVATLQERLGTGLHVAKGRGGSAVRSLVGV
jgi:exonuclease SbcC